MGATPSTELFTIHNADALLVLASMPDESVDSIVTDPPYEIGFMGRAWDSTGIAYNTDLWAECLRVLKPGGHLLSFGATRSYHRMAVAIEDAGFEIRDSIHWTYGSGFPKSKNVALAVDKGEGHPNRGRAIPTASTYQACDTDKKNKLTSNPVPDYEAKSEAAKSWAGWGTALKPSHEPIVVARKPLAGTVAQNVLAHGTGALNIDGCRVGFVSDADEKEAKDKNQHADFGTKVTDTPNVYGDYSMVEVKNYNPPGRWPANTVLTHSPECRRTGETTDSTSAGNRTATFGQEEKTPGGNGSGGYDGLTVTVPLYVCVQGCPVAVLDRQSGTLSQGHWAKTKVTGYGTNYGGTADYSGPGEKAADKGGASRFFTQTEWSEWDAPFLYVAKPSKKERNAGLDEANNHPTVKPVSLLRHLVRLVTPPGGVVLDPFLGSGTTGVAALLEGFQFIGIEMTAEYLPIIEGRLAHALASVQEQAEKQPDLFSA